MTIHSSPHTPHPTNHKSSHLVQKCERRPFISSAKTSVNWKRPLMTSLLPPARPVWLCSLLAPIVTQAATPARSRDHHVSPLLGTQCGSLWRGWLPPAPRKQLPAGALPPACHRQQPRIGKGRKLRQGSQQVPRSRSTVTCELLGGRSARRVRRQPWLALITGAIAGRSTRRRLRRARRAENGLNPRQVRQLRAKRRKPLPRISMTSSHLVHPKRRPRRRQRKEPCPFQQPR